LLFVSWGIGCWEEEVSGLGFCLNFCSMVCPDSVCVEEMDLRVVGSVFWRAVEHGWLDRHPFLGLEDFVLIGGKK
jgi:hypothetical protein